MPVYDEYKIHFSIAHDGSEFAFGEVRGVPFGIPVALGKSNAVQRIMQNTGCTPPEAEACYYAVLGKHYHASAPVTFDVYEEYLGSDAWRKRRRQALRAGGFMCSMCGSRRNLDVHHLTYTHIGDELPDELVVLCHRCHQLTHGLKEAGS